jgi:TPP-dependent indolepyruvate ferredoxin oxidoreductase alpha subunit
MTTTRQKLKLEIIDYLRTNCHHAQTGAPLTIEQVTKCFAAIKDVANDWSDQIDEGTFDYLDRKTAKYAKDLGLKIGDVFHVRIAYTFSPTHYFAIAKFVEQLQEILMLEAEEQKKIEDAINAEIEQQSDPYELYYDEMGGPDFAIKIYEEHIIVEAYEKGVGEIIPKKNRKYIGRAGEISWMYPLSALDSLKKTNRPIVNIKEVENRIKSLSCLTSMVGE